MVFNLNAFSIMPGLETKAVENAHRLMVPSAGGAQQYSTRDAGRSLRMLRLTALASPVKKLNSSPSSSAD